MLTRNRLLAGASALAAASFCSRKAIQIFGGIGFTWEHDAHLFWRRAKVDRFLLGDDVAAYDEVARLALDAASAPSREAVPSGG